MREILFRGKHTHAFSKNDHLDGRWIYGYLCDENYINSPELEGEFLVDPKTVCQYTGLTDKNGRKIFEGDIVKDTFLHTIGKVFYWEYEGRFAFDDVNDDAQFYMGEMWEDCEVIGNIFDNPNLLKE